MTVGGAPSEPWRVGINVQLVHNQGVGGVQSAIVGLINALGRLDGPEEAVAPREEAPAHRPEGAAGMARVSRQGNEIKG